MILGGGFIGEFVGETPWIHLDIAGTSETKRHMTRSKRSNRRNGTHTSDRNRAMASTDLDSE